MLRGIFISKIRNNRIDLNAVNNFITEINSRMNYTEEISEEEYHFSYLISNGYSKNLKIRIPKFEPKDAFYLFYRYDKGNKYKLSEIFDEVNINFGGIDIIAETIIKKNDYDNMVDISEDIGKLFYQNICGKDPKYEGEANLFEFLNNELSKEKEAKKKK